MNLLTIVFKNMIKLVLGRMTNWIKLIGPLLAIELETKMQLENLPTKNWLRISLKKKQMDQDSRPIDPVKIGEVGG